MRSLTAAVVLVVLVSLSGCSSGNDKAARRAAENLHASLRAGDGAAACDVLSDEVQKEIAQSQGTSCESAVMEPDIPDSGRILDVKVYGTAAQVRYDEDVVFLGEFEDGWKVTAAGCSRQAGAPYDCELQGG